MQSPNTAKRAAAALDSEAKSESDRLRNVLGSQPPWSKEVELHRQQCRNAHLTLLFSHPFSPYSQSLDSLWLHTTYVLIQAYRDLISRLERFPPASSNSNGGSKGRRGGGGGGNSELKKALTRFRQVLASEETFYRSLVARLVRFYNLGELSGVDATLKTIKLPTEYMPTNDSDEDESSHAAQFASLQEKKDKIPLLYKGLICLGDLERYKEQYKQPINNNRHAQERERQADKFEAAEEYYLAAWSLMPDDGAAWNQLAVISTYIHNDYATTYYYYRALAVKNAFQGADGILQRFFGRVFDKWRAKRKEGDGEEGGGEVGDGVEKWKEEMVVLMAILYLKAGFTYIPTILPPLLTSLKVLLAERRLPTESIVHLTSILLGSHFRARSTSGLEQDPNLLKRSFEAEGKTLEVALGVWKVYLEIAREEVEEARASLRRGLEDSALLDDEDEEEELETDEMPQLISAVLRRILPSLRIISKWLKLNTTYLSRLASPSSNDQASSPELRAAISSFWNTYHAFFQSSSKLFILERLPSITRPLEEDIDMRGFAPLQKGKTADIDSFAAGATSATDSADGGGDVDGGYEGREVHPNEEHLMRLGDIQVDGLLIGQSLGYADPLHTFTSGTFAIPEATELPNVPRVDEYEREHDLQSISTNTEDDPVNLAMRASLGVESVDEEDDEDEEEVIVWNRGRENVVDTSVHQPVRSIPAQIPAPMIPPPQHRLQHQQSQTAMDLLQDLLQSNSPVVHSSGNNSPALGASSSSPYAHQLSPSYTQAGFPGMSKNMSGPSAGIPSPHNTQMPPGMSVPGPAPVPQPVVRPVQQQQHHPGQAKNPGQVPSLFLGSQGGSIWTMTREESQQGRARRSGTGAGTGPGMGWVGGDEGPQGSVASSQGPPGFGIPQAPPQIAQPLAAAQMHQPQPQAHVPMQNMGLSTSTASATLQAQATFSRPSPGPVAALPNLTHRPSMPKLHHHGSPARQTPIQVQHPTRQPRGPSANPSGTWGLPNMNMGGMGMGMSNVPLPVPKSEGEVPVPYYMRPGVFGGGAGTPAGAGGISGVGGGVPGAGAGSGSGNGTGSGSGGDGAGQGIWDGTRSFGMGQGWMSGS
ncbi:hypothetical protein AYX13_03614 [Cryptococcus neoformans]|nr:hypothetical protein AYX13_03614 [Cryptococcus neoformans var. grubii]